MDVNVGDPDHSIGNQVNRVVLCSRVQHSIQFPSWNNIIPAQTRDKRLEIADSVGGIMIHKKNDLYSASGDEGVLLL